MRMNFCKFLRIPIDETNCLSFRTPLNFMISSRLLTLSILRSIAPFTEFSISLESFYIEAFDVSVEKRLPVERRKEQFDVRDFQSS